MPWPLHYEIWKYCQSTSKVHASVLQNLRVWQLFRHQAGVAPCLTHWRRLQAFKWHHSIAASCVAWQSGGMGRGESPLEMMVNVMGLQEVQHLLQLVQDDINPQKIVQATLQDLPSLSRQFLLGWSDRVLTS